MRIPYGSYDSVILHEGVGECCGRKIQGSDVRYLHRIALHRPDLRDNHAYKNYRRRRCDSGYFQLALNTLAAEHHILHRVHGIRGLILRSI